MSQLTHDLRGEINAISLLLAIIERPYHPTAIEADQRMGQYKEVIDRAQGGNATDAEVETAITDAKEFVVRLKQEFAEASLP